MERRTRGQRPKETRGTMNGTHEASNQKRQAEALTPGNVKNVKEKATPTTKEHAHHWIIEEAHGSKSAGHCKTCSATKEFKNWLPETDFVTTRDYEAGNHLFI